VVEKVALGHVLAVHPSRGSQPLIRHQRGQTMLLPLTVHPRQHLDLKLSQFTRAAPTQWRLYWRGKTNI
jgi:hypothetical protein